MYRIVDNIKLNDNVIKIVIENQLIANKVKPGQFVIIQIDDLGERIPLTVADYDTVTGTVSLIVQTVGLTTKKLAALQVDDCLKVMVGPLGNTTEFEDANNILVIGGGVGLAIAYPSAKYLHNQGRNVDVVAGFRNQAIVILENEIKENSSNCIICTDDGSNGTKGFVTEYAKQLLDEKKYDLVVCIGPLPMMRAVCNLTKEYNVRTIISLNSIMIDGTGMCGGCRVTIDGKVKFACVDGPDFDGHAVDFNELMKRNSTYKAQESHKCRLYDEKMEAEVK